ncbi:hypothetical protein [Rhodococcus globerulus]|uniref:hypothetical protein n=1 Tax=Rhodococcus globerulus TaxID=33008 RepID=UPI00301B53A4
MALHRRLFRGFGIRRYTLLMGFTLAALNILILRDWHTRREQADPWGKFLGEPEPQRMLAPRRRHSFASKRHGGRSS